MTLSWAQKMRYCLIPVLYDRTVLVASDADKIFDFINSRLGQDGLRLSTRRLELWTVDGMLTGCLAGSELPVNEISDQQRH